LAPWSHAPKASRIAQAFQPGANRHSRVAKLPPTKHFGAADGSRLRKKIFSGTDALQTAAGASAVERR